MLTATLGDALPAGMVEVERDRSLGDPLAGRPGTPVAVRVQGTDRELELRTGRAGPVGEVRQVVCGIVLGRRTVPLEEWVGVLATELTALGERSAAAREALGRMLGTG